MSKRKYKEIKSFLYDLKKDFRIEKVIFFGSRASGAENKNSDIDLIIVSDDFRSMDFFERVTKMYKYWKINVPVDFICYTVKEFEIMKKRASIVREALNNGIVV